MSEITTSTRYTNMSHSQFVRSSFAFSNKWSDRHQSPIQIEVIPCPMALEQHRVKSPSVASPSPYSHSAPCRTPSPNNSPPTATTDYSVSATIEQRNLGNGFACHWTINTPNKSTGGTTRKFFNFANGGAGGHNLKTSAPSATSSRRKALSQQKHKNCHQSKICKKSSAVTPSSTSLAMAARNRRSSKSTMAMSDEPLTTSKHSNHNDYAQRNIKENVRLQEQLYRSMFEMLVGNSELEKIEHNYRLSTEQRKKSQNSLEWLQVDRLVT